MLKDISIHRPIWIGFDDLKHRVDTEKEMYQCRTLAAMRAARVAGSCLQKAVQQKLLINV